jgi:predicted nucleotidyltransferase component of viral defense system
MGKNVPVVLGAEQQLHVDIMRAIARDFYDLPMVLKGGTALLLCYGLDRFSEDLDFDAPKKFNVAGRVEKILAQRTMSHSVRTVKDTATVQRLKAHYTGVTSDRLLKIETSFRTQPSEDETVTIDGIRTYSIQALIAQKIDALEHRTAARDLYDISFLINQYPNHFSPKAVQKLAVLVSDVDAVEGRFQEAFEEDEILDASRLVEIVVQVAEFVRQRPCK